MKIDNKKLLLTYADREKLQEVFRKGYNLKQISKSVEDNPNLTEYQIKKEVMLGLREEEYEKKLYGLYKPERVVLSILQSYFDDDSIEAFVKWFKSKEYLEEEKNNG